MVVPIRATERSRNDLEATKWGHSVFDDDGVPVGVAEDGGDGVGHEDQGHKKKIRSA